MHDVFKLFWGKFSHIKKQHGVIEIFMFVKLRPMNCFFKVTIWSLFDNSTVVGIKLFLL